MQYAVQRRDTGCIVAIYPNLASAKVVTDMYDYLVSVPVDDNDHLEVRYVELSGPSGYGCDCPELESYGKPVELANYLTKFVQQATHQFGPDIRDIRDYLSHCHVTVNGDSYDNWAKIVDDVCSKQTIYI